MDEVCPTLEEILKKPKEQWTNLDIQCWKMHMRGKGKGKLISVV